jgi:polyisoprenoid-binding protein YceI
MKPDKPEIDHESVQLVDVRLAEEFEAAHLEGAISNCVFEVAFEDRLGESAPDKTKPTILYGADGESREAEMAKEKLMRLGYRMVDLLDGGFAVARTVLPVIEGEPLPEPPPEPDGLFLIDTHASRAGWTGRNLLNKHHGSIAIRSGELVFQNGLLTRGTVVVDPNQLVCDDLDGPLHDVLIAHLQSHDFFDTAVHPEIHIEITGSAESEVFADLTIKEITHPITIPIASGVTPDGLPAAQGTIAIDRTRWNVLYGSKKFFHRLAGHMVNDRIEIELRILTRSVAMRAP